MAKIDEDSILNYLLGMIGQQVIVKRSRSGRRYISAKPEYHHKPTKSQIAYARRFRKEAVYGKAASDNPELKKLYAANARPGCSAYIMAWRDAHYAPVVNRITFAAYKNKRRDVVLIDADDDFMVVSVHIFLYNHRNQIIEDGEAIHDSGNTWRYYVKTATTATMIEAKAYDLPGNQGSLKVDLTN